VSGVQADPVTPTKAAFQEDDERFSAVMDELVEVDDHGDSRRMLIIREDATGDLWGCDVEARRYDGYEYGDIYRVVARTKTITEYVRLR
jgi:hypothetical protein